MLPFAADIPPGPAPPPLSWRVWVISGHGPLSQNNGWGKEMLAPVVLSPHTQGLQPEEGGFNIDEWYIKVAGPATATAWGLAQMGQPCPSVGFSAPSTCCSLSFSAQTLAKYCPLPSCPLLPPWPQSYGYCCSPATKSPQKSTVAAGLSPLPVSQLQATGASQGNCAQATVF